MTTLPGYDEWKTREPDEGPKEDLRWYVQLINPHNPRQPHLGPFYDEGGAEEAAKEWVAMMRKCDARRYRNDYAYEKPYSIDLNEGCTCGRTLRSRRNCEIHGVDPDEAH